MSEENMSEEKKGPMDRRSLLKLIGAVAGGAGAPPAFWQAELTRGEYVDTAQDRFAKSALADGEIRRVEIAPWIE